MRVKVSIEAECSGNYATDDRVASALVSAAFTPEGRAGNHFFTAEVLSEIAWRISSGIKVAQREKLWALIYEIFGDEPRTKFVQDNADIYHDCLKDDAYGEGEVPS